MPQKEGRIKLLYEGIFKVKRFRPSPPFLASKGKQSLKPASIVPKNRTPCHDAWVEVDNFKKVPADSHPMNLIDK